MDVLLHNNKLWEAVQNDFFQTYRELPDVPTATTLPFLWKGHRIDYETCIKPVMSFFLDHPTDEVQVRVYYNIKTGEWKPWAFPQRFPCGMHTSELPNHPNFAEDMRQFTDEWRMLMTIHHHCKASAFQSGTDHKDEINVDGLHITYGFLDKPVLDWHARVSFNKGFYQPILSNWFFINDHVDAMPDKYRDDIVKHYLTTPIEANQRAYPTRWTDNLIRYEAPKPNYHSRFPHNPYGMHGTQPRQMYNGYDLQDEDDFRWGHLNAQHEPTAEFKSPSYIPLSLPFLEENQLTLRQSLPIYYASRFKELGFTSMEAMAQATDALPYECLTIFADAMDLFRHILPTTHQGNLDNEAFVIIPRLQYAAALYDAVDDYLYEEQLLIAEAEAECEAKAEAALLGESMVTNSDDPTIGRAQ